MKWFHGLPKETGYYWFRNTKIKDEWEPHIHQVRNYAGKLAIGNSYLENWPRMETGEWAGPIP